MADGEPLREHLGEIAERIRMMRKKLAELKKEAAEAAEEKPEEDVSE